MPKPKPVKPSLCVFVGDTHCGGDTGLAVPGFRQPSKDNRPYSASGDQLWLYECWQDFNKQIKERAKGHRLFVGLGGDMTDGVMHHGTTQTSGVTTDQVLMAEALVKPLVNIADDCLGLLGTASHVGDVGNMDMALYEMLHIDYAPYFEGVVTGINKRLWWSHHGVPVGQKEATKDNGGFNLAKDLSDYCVNERIEKPQAVIGHDRHKTFEPVTARGITIAITPCFQLPTYYGQRWPFKPTVIGYLLWWPDQNRMEIKTYAKPRKVRYIFSSSRIKD